jgi:hypothetical protein
MEKRVIFIEQPQENDKPVEFTHALEGAGWAELTLKPFQYEKVVYLGKCVIDGDMFAGYYFNGSINILKGHLNSGRY